MSRYIHGLKRMSENPAFIQSNPSFQKLIGIADNWENEKDRYKKALEEIANFDWDNSTFGYDEIIQEFQNIAKEALK